MNLAQLKANAVNSIASEVVDFVLQERVFQENYDEYHDFLYDCLDVDSLGYMGDTKFTDIVEEKLREKILDMIMEWHHHAVHSGLSKGIKILLDLDYNTELTNN